MTAGRRDTLLTLQRYTVTQDDYGEEQPTWADIGTEWAAIYWGRGDERRQAAMEQGTQAATFNMLSNTLTRSLTLRDRISGEAGTFDIVGVAPDTPKRGEIEFTATRSL
ncbi:MAG: head-tail adaptor protein [Tsuneonella sp.]